jgi:hypothetical protein
MVSNHSQKVKNAANHVDRLSTSSNCGCRTCGVRLWMNDCRMNSYPDPVEVGGSR